MPRLENHISKPIILRADSIVTPLVQEYLKNGYTLYIGDNSSGSQGEYFSIYLTNDNGKTVLKIYGKRKWHDNHDAELHVITEKFTNNNQLGTLWNGRGDVLSDNIWYMHEGTKGQVLYLKNYKEYKRIQELKLKRMESRKKTPRLVTTSDKAKMVAFKLLTKKKGLKQIRLNDIDKIVREKSRCYVYINKRGRILVYDAFECID